MNIVFFGSSQYSLIVAEALYKKFGLQLIVTKPGAVAEFAEKNNIPFITPKKLTESPPGRWPNGLLPGGRAFRPDFFVVADYGLIIPKSLLDLPKFAPLNVHHSLLPKYRGPTPAPAAILAGEKITGVSIIKMAEKVDAGDILEQKEYEIKSAETTDSLLRRLNTLGAEIIIPVIENFEEVSKHARKQDESQATYTPRLTRESGYIEISNVKFQMSNLKSKEKELEIENWKLKIDRMVRAYYPWPGVWCKFRIQNSEFRIKLLPTSSENPILLQVEGKKPMSVKDFINGYPSGKELVEKLGLI